MNIATHHTPLCPYVSAQMKTRLKNAMRKPPESAISMKEYFASLANRLGIIDYGQHVGFEHVDQDCRVPIVERPRNVSSKWSALVSLDLNGKKKGMKRGQTLLHSGTFHSFTAAKEKALLDDSSDKMSSTETEASCADMYHDINEAVNCLSIDRNYTSSSTKRLKRIEKSPCKDAVISLERMTQNPRVPEPRGENKDKAPTFDAGAHNSSSQEQHQGEAPTFNAGAHNCSDDSTEGNTQYIPHLKSTREASAPHREYESEGAYNTTSIDERVSIFAPSSPQKTNIKKEAYTITKGNIPVIPLENPIISTEESPIIFPEERLARGETFHISSFNSSLSSVGRTGTSSLLAKPNTDMKHDVSTKTDPNRIVSPATKMEQDISPLFVYPGSDSGSEISNNPSRDSDSRFEKHVDAKANRAKLRENSHSSPTSAKAPVSPTKRPMRSSPRIKSLMLGLPSDRDAVSEFMYLLLEQARPRNLEDEGAFCIECRHCALEEKPYKVFPTSARRFCTSLRAFCKHVMECQKKPEDLKERLLFLQKEEAGKFKKKRCLDLFYKKIWERLQCSTSGTTPNDQLPKQEDKVRAPAPTKSNFKHPRIKSKPAETNLEKNPTAPSKPRRKNTRNNATVLPQKVVPLFKKEKFLRKPRAKKQKPC